MKSKGIKASLAIVLCLAMMLLSGDLMAFSLTGTDFSGILAYNGDGYVIEQYGQMLGPQFGSEFYGHGFNLAGALTFDFEYLPYYPTISDVKNNPGTRWLWTATVRNLRLPCCEEPLPDLSWTRIASYGDILSGAEWAEAHFGHMLPENLAYNLAYEFNSPTTGTAWLGMATTIDQSLLPDNFPNDYYWACDSGIEVEISADPLVNPAIPEPMTLMLFGAGVAGIGIVRRRR